MGLLAFFREVRRSRYFRHGVLLGALAGVAGGVPLGWAIHVPRPSAAPVKTRPAVSLPMEVGRGFPQGEEILFSVRVRNTTGEVFENLQVECAFVDSTGALLGAGGQSWSSVAPDQVVTGVIHASNLLGTTKAECQARGQ